MPLHRAGGLRRRPSAAWLLWLLAALPVVRAAEALEFPALSGRVVDAANLLQPDTEALLTRELAAYERSSGGTQIVVATVPSLQGQDIAEFGYQLGRHWGIGARDSDTGALLLVAPEERQVRIEVGYGLEGDLTDAVSWDIIQGRILPRFRDGDFDGGVIEGARAIMAALGGEYEPVAASSDEERQRLPALFFWIFVMIILFSSFGRRRRRRGGLAQALLIGSMLGGGRGRGGFGGGGFGGGGFSGGGGSFGGGGASGGW